MPDKEWRVRVRVNIGYPPSYHGPYTRQEVADYLALQFEYEQPNLFEIIVTRGDCGGEIKEWSKETNG